MRRLPVTLSGVYTYRAPQGVAPRLERGAFVRVPFRQRESWAVCLGEGSPPPGVRSQALRTIIDLNDDVQLTEAEIAAIELTARQFHISPATVAFLEFPTPPTRQKTRQVDASYKQLLHEAPTGNDEWIREAHTGARDTIVVPQTHAQRLETIKRICLEVLSHGRSVVICTPYRSWILPLAEALRDLPTVCLDRDATKKHALWDAFLRSRSGPTCIIATRGGAFLAPPALGAFIIDLAHSDDLKERDAQPKFDARTLTAATARRLSLPRFIFSPAPRVEEWSGATRRVIVGKSGVGPHIVSLQHFWRAGGQGLLTDELQASLGEALAQKRPALVLHNRRGKMGRMTCSACSVVAACGTCDRALVEHDDGVRCHACTTSMKPPAQCMACGTPFFRTSSMGTQGVVALLARVFPDAHIARVDRDAPRLPPSDAEIIVATERFLHSLAPSMSRSMGLVAILHADRFTRGNDYAGNVRLLAALRMTMLWARTWDAQILLQVTDPNHPAVLAIANDRLASFYRNELAERLALQFPPATRLLRCDRPGDSNDGDEAMRRLLLEAGGATVLSIDGPFSFGYVRERSVTSLLIRFRAGTEDEVIASVISLIPEPWSVDLDPISLHA